MVVISRDGIRPSATTRPRVSRPTSRSAGTSRRDGGAEPAVVTDSAGEVPEYGHAFSLPAARPGGTPGGPVDVRGPSVQPRSTGSRDRVNRPAPSIATSGTTTRTPSVGHGHHDRVRRRRPARSLAYRRLTAARMIDARCRGRPTMPSTEPSTGDHPGLAERQHPAHPGPAPTAARVDRSARPSAAASPVATPAAPRVISPAAAASRSSSGRRVGAPPVSTLELRACRAAAGRRRTVPAAVLVGRRRGARSPSRSADQLRPSRSGGGRRTAAAGLRRQPGGQRVPRDGRVTVVGRSGPASTSADAGRSPGRRARSAGRSPRRRRPAAPRWRRPPSAGSAPVSSGQRRPVVDDRSPGRSAEVVARGSGSGDPRGPAGCCAVGESGRRAVHGQARARRAAPARRRSSSVRSGPQLGVCTGRDRAGSELVARPRSATWASVGCGRSGSDPVDQHVAGRQRRPVGRAVAGVVAGQVYRRSRRCRRRRPSRRRSPARRRPGCGRRRAARSAAPAAAAGRAGRPGRPGPGCSRPGPARRGPARPGSPPGRSGRRRARRPRRPPAASASPTASQRLRDRAMPRRPASPATTSCRAAVKAGTSAASTPASTARPAIATSAAGKHAVRRRSGRRRRTARPAGGRRTRRRRRAAMPAAAPTTPSTTPSASTMRRRCAASPPLAATSASSRRRRRAPTAKAGPASSTDLQQAEAADQHARCSASVGRPPRATGDVGRVGGGPSGTAREATTMPRALSRRDQRRGRPAPGSVDQPARAGVRPVERRRPRAQRDLRARSSGNSTTPTTVYGPAAVGGGDGAAEADAQAAQRRRVSATSPGAVGRAAGEHRDQPAGQRVGEVQRRARSTPVAGRGAQRRTATHRRSGLTRLPAGSSAVSSAAVTGAVAGSSVRSVPGVLAARRPARSGPSATQLQLARRPRPSWRSACSAGVSSNMS